MPFVFKNNEDIGDLLTGSRVCVVCSERKSMDNFYWANGKKSRRRKCKDCARLRALDVRASKPEAYRSADRRRQFRKKYGITLEQFDSMLAAQDNKCAICSKSFTSKMDSIPHVDHCHTTGKVRDILCFTCNTALGKFKDSELLLQNAITYLRKHNNAD